MVYPSSNYQQIFKRSESSGFMNFGSNLNSNKSNRGIKNSVTSKKFMGLSNSLVNMGYINNDDKKLRRNASELFLWWIFLYKNVFNVKNIVSYINGVIKNK